MLRLYRSGAKGDPKGDTKEQKPKERQPRLLTLFRLRPMKKESSNNPHEPAPETIHSDTSVPVLTKEADPFADDSRRLQEAARVYNKLYIEGKSPEERPEPKTYKKISLNKTSPDNSIPNNGIPTEPQKATGLKKLFGGRKISAELAKSKTDKKLSLHNAVAAEVQAELSADLWTEPTASIGSPSRPVSERSEWVDIADSDDDGTSNDGPDRCLYTARSPVAQAVGPQALAANPGIPNRLHTPPPVSYRSRYQASQPTPRAMPVSNFSYNNPAPAMTGGFLALPAQAPAQLARRDNSQRSEAPRRMPCTTVNWRFNQFGDREPFDPSPAPLEEYPDEQTTSSRAVNGLPRPESYANPMPEHSELDQRSSVYPALESSSADRSTLAPRFTQYNDEGLGIHVDQQEYDHDATVVDNRSESNYSRRSSWGIPSAVQDTPATVIDTPTIALDDTDTSWEEPALTLDPDTAMGARRGRRVTTQWTQSVLMDSVLNMLYNNAEEQVPNGDPQDLGQRIDQLRSEGRMVARQLPEVPGQTPTLEGTDGQSRQRYSVIAAETFDLSNLSNGEPGPELVAADTFDLSNLSNGEPGPELVAAELAYDHTRRDATRYKRRSIFARIPAAASPSAQANGDDEEADWYAVLVDEDAPESEADRDEGQDGEQVDEGQEDENSRLTTGQDELPRTGSAMSGLRFDSGVSGLEDVASRAEVMGNPAFLTRVLQHVPAEELAGMTLVSSLWHRVVLRDTRLYDRAFGPYA
ncbi:hypothetical protein K490DRAFT_64821 [Saccharata proteae CBS 121410]|uniref:F-box domain-containing protein n=1 Tax=Saccharata proteae CBS 121410 TaxID=1314787 RepID=A0A9P4HWK0_9PEZI|nr:hypothetical protein K490DRAFT_64821 [Saccharata proteae CBS 121410]